tara:strand:- start:9508 stop:9744 length:237 start_codon:yes stop_codon:yes gene_type:complete
MTVDELIEQLIEYRDVLGGDTEVRSMQQPSWPFEYSIDGLVSTEEMGSSKDDRNPTNETKVFILEGTQLCYGSKSAWG